MRPEEISRVEDSFAAIGPITQPLGMRFYARLFEIDPSAKPLFSRELRDQALVLMQVLAFAVSNLRAPETLLPIIRDLGRRHRDYGVADGHYDSVRTALLATIGEALGQRWTLETAAAWTAAYDLLAGEMKAGAADR